MNQQNLNMVPITDGMCMSTADLQANSTTMAQNGSPMQSENGSTQGQPLSMDQIQNMKDIAESDDKIITNDDGEMMNDEQEDNEMTMDGMAESFANLFDNSGEYDWWAIGVFVFVLLSFLIGLVVSSGSTSTKKMY